MSGEPVSGEVACPLANHSAIASRSYEKPSEVETLHAKCACVSQAIVVRCEKKECVRDPCYFVSALRAHGSAMISEVIGHRYASGTVAMIKREARKGR